MVVLNGCYYKCWCIVPRNISPMRLCWWFFFLTVLTIEYLFITPKFLPPNFHNVLTPSTGKTLSLFPEWSWIRYFCGASMWICTIVACETSWNRSRTDSFEHVKPKRWRFSACWRPCQCKWSPKNGAKSCTASEISFLVHINSMGRVTVQWRCQNNQACPKLQHPKNRSATVAELKLQCFSRFQLFLAVISSFQPLLVVTWCCT